jgi:Ca2+-binding RTX toxin-like protein
MKNLDLANMILDLNMGEQISSVEEDSGTDDPTQSQKLAKVSLPFIENQGQVDQEVKFYASTFGGTVFVTDSGLTYALTDGTSEDDRTVQGIAIKEKFLTKTQQALIPTGMDKSDTIVNYFVGKEENWRSNIPAYHSVDLSEVWPSINVELRAYGKNVEKIFRVEPGGSVEDIRLAMEGIRGLDINEKGQLLLDTELGAVAMTEPLAFQDIDGTRRSVEVTYTASDTIYGFAVGHYDPSYTLYIDPLLASTFIGGIDAEGATDITVDGSGNVFISGFTISNDYPTTPGAYNHSLNNFSEDVFVSKFNSDLSDLPASTYIGGSGNELGPRIVLDVFGNVFITGQTFSADYPFTAGAYDTTYNGDGDVFVSRLNNDLSLLLASTFIGGSATDLAFTSAVSLDGSGNVFVAGQTLSADYPFIAGAYDTTYNGGGDVFVSKLNSGLSSLGASTFIGGTNFDFLSAIVIEGSGNVYITGQTFSESYPTTSGAYDKIFDDADGFVSKLSSNLSDLPASTFLGGSDIDFPSDITLDSFNNVLVTGDTFSADYPFTLGAYDTTYNGLGGTSDGFVSKLDNNLSSLLASTYIGGSVDDSASSIAIDGSGSILITGFTFSDDYPTTPGAYNTTYSDGQDVFVSKLSSDLSDLPVSTYIGGSVDDSASSIAIDGSGSIFITGQTSSDGYPTTPGAYNTTYNGDDVFISKFSNDLLLDPPPTFCGKTIDQFANVIDGTEEDDELIGTSNGDLIRGFGGHDLIKGRGGPDCLIGGDDNDTILGGGRDDMIEGNDGNDILKGGAGNDVIFGGNDDDTLRGARGDDTLDGEDGTDSCLGGDGANTITNCE